MALPRTYRWPRSTEMATDDKKDNKTRNRVLAGTGIAAAVGGTYAVRRKSSKGGQEASKPTETSKSPPANVKESVHPVEEFKTEAEKKRAARTANKAAIRDKHYVSPARNNPRVPRGAVGKGQTAELPQLRGKRLVHELSKYQPLAEEQQVVNNRLEKLVKNAPTNKHAANALARFGKGDGVLASIQRNVDYAFTTPSKLNQVKDTPEYASLKSVYDKGRDLKTTAIKQLHTNNREAEGKVRVHAEDRIKGIIKNSSSSPKMFKNAGDQARKLGLDDPNHVSKGILTDQRELRASSPRAATIIDYRNKDARDRLERGRGHRVRDRADALGMTRTEYLAKHPNIAARNTLNAAEHAGRAHPATHVTGVVDSIKNAGKSLVGKVIKGKL